MTGYGGHARIGDRRGGVARVDGVRAQQGYLTLDDLDALRDAVRSRWDAPREGEWLTETLDHRYFELHGRRAIELALLSERPHTIVIQPWVIRARLIGRMTSTLGSPGTAKTSRGRSAGGRGRMGSCSIACPARWHQRSRRRAVQPAFRLRMSR